MSNDIDTSDMPLPEGVKWDIKKTLTICGRLPSDVLREWNYGWVHVIPGTQAWRVQLWFNQSDSHIETIEPFLTHKEAVNYLWLKFILEHGET